MARNSIGIVGLSVMGGNLAMNIADAGFPVAVYNRTREKTDTLVKDYAGSGTLAPFFDLPSFVGSLASPRIVLLMVQAGDAVDAVIGQVVPLLAEGDVIIDAGNSFFRDTQRREKATRERGMYFVGMGVSGGEEGARKGPSIMPGGSWEAWEIIRPIVERIAAKDFSGKPCVAHIGADGAGHYVKMVHNGIEYIDMQLIAETYWIMKKSLSLGNDAIADVFAGWNGGRLNSYLIEITEKILRVKNERGASLVDDILDRAGGKGTGMWTAQEAVSLGIPAHAMTAALFARYSSAEKVERLVLSEIYAEGSHTHDTSFTVDDLEPALYAAKLLAYAQGFKLLAEAARTYGWRLSFREIARIWQGGCIIRARFLQELSETFSAAPAEQSPLSLPFFTMVLRDAVPILRRVTSAALANALPIPAMLGSLTYFDSMTAASSSANIIQAQRDFFGAHGIQTGLDGSFFHHPWQSE